MRTKNIQASRSRTENFVSSVSSHSQPSLDSHQSASPLYNTPTKSRTPQPGYQNSNPDILNLDPSSSSALTRGGPQSDQQLLMMEEAQPTNTYINMRGEAIDVIEKTISELGSVFGQLAAMVSEQGFVTPPLFALPKRTTNSPPHSEMVQRIDANTEDVVDNVQGAQRELMKYWSRVSGNRWLVAKMFGVLMVMCPCQAPKRRSGPSLSSCGRFFFSCGFLSLGESTLLMRRIVAFTIGAVKLRYILIDTRSFLFFMFRSRAPPPPPFYKGFLVIYLQTYQKKT